MRKIKMLFKMKVFKIGTVSTIIVYLWSNESFVQMKITSVLVTTNTYFYYINILNNIFIINKRRII